MILSTIRALTLTYPASTWIYIGAHGMLVHPTDPHLLYLQLFSDYVSKKLRLKPVPLPRPWPVPPEAPLSLLPDMDRLISALRDAEHTKTLVRDLNRARTSFIRKYS